MAKLKLDLPLQIDFELLAIVTPLKNYRLAFFLNKWLDISLERKDDLTVDLVKKQQVASFPKFYFYEPLEKMHYYLLNNKVPSTATRLVPELKQVDFLMMLKGDDTDYVKQNFLNRILKIPQVQTCFEVNVDELFSKQNLVFDDETF